MLSATFIDDVTIPDNQIVSVGDSVEKTWRLQNSGEIKWPEGTRVTFFDGEKMTAWSALVPPAQPNELVEVAIQLHAPSKTGTYKSSFRLFAPKEGFFGTSLWVLVKCVEPRMRFVNDLTVPDGTRFKPGEAFVKQWKLQNSGSCCWPENCQLIFCGGHPLNGEFTLKPDTNRLGVASYTSVTMKFEAPTIKDNYQSKWKLVMNNGMQFGPTFWCEIEVDDPPELKEPSAPDAVGDGEECSVCLSAKKCMAFMECGHLCACGPCSQTIMSGRNPRCPMCRRHIKKAMRIFS